MHDICDNSVHDYWEHHSPSAEDCEVLPGDPLISGAGANWFRLGASQQMQTTNLIDLQITNSNILQTASSNNLQTVSSNNLQMYSEFDEEDVHDPPTDSEEDVSVWTI